MPQTFVVVQCAFCKAFQGTLDKKSKKFACAICGQKQSFRHVHAISNKGADVRKVVQELNSLRGAQDAAYTDPDYDTAQAQLAVQNANSKPQQQALAWDDFAEPEEEDGCNDDEGGCTQAEGPFVTALPDMKGRGTSSISKSGGSSRASKRQKKSQDDDEDDDRYQPQQQQRHPGRQLKSSGSHVFGEAQHAHQHGSAGVRPPLHQSHQQQQHVQHTRRFTQVPRPLQHGTAAMPRQQWQQQQQQQQPAASQDAAAWVNSQHRANQQPQQQPKQQQQQQQHWRPGQQHLQQRNGLQPAAGFASSGDQQAKKTAQPASKSAWGSFLEDEGLGPCSSDGEADIDEGVCCVAAPLAAKWA